MNHRFIDFTQVEFLLSEGDYEFSGPSAYMDHHLSDFIPHFFRFPGCIK
jgi:hypothetical protein